MEKGAVLKKRKLQRLLVVDDDAQMRQELRDLLSSEDYIVSEADSVATTKKMLKEDIFNIVILDVKLTDGNGISLLKKIKKKDPQTRVIMLTGYPSIKNAASSLNDGAFAYIQKPLHPEEIFLHIRRAAAANQAVLRRNDFIKKLHDQSLKDPLTKLYNRNYLKTCLNSELKRAQRYGLFLSIAMLDIDNFKTLNDVYGHTYGDMILREFARLLATFVRVGDVVVRYGGDEFVIILPETYKMKAVSFGERFLATLAEHVFDEDGEKINLTVSIGIAGFPYDVAKNESGKTLINRADKALLQVKSSGRNRVAVAP